MLDANSHKSKSRILRYTGPDSLVDDMEEVAHAFVTTFRDIGLSITVARGIVIDNGVSSLKPILSDPDRMKLVVARFLKRTVKS